MTINDDDYNNNDDDSDDDSYSGDQLAYNAPKLSVLLYSMILSTGHTKVLLDTWAVDAAQCQVWSLYKNLQRTYVQTTA